jgi:phosphotriesterase-related protein
MTTTSKKSGSLTVPNLNGKALTVNGPVDPAELGVTLMHEHLLIDLRKQVWPNHNTPATRMALWDQKVTLENLQLARNLEPIADAWILADEEVAISEATEFSRLGGNTIVEVSSIGLRRDPSGLRRISHATGLNIIMGSGWYKKLFHPDNMDHLTVQEMTDVIVSDVALGVGDTGVRSGIIGEIGIEGNPIEPNEVKSLQAAARASRATGAAISLHRGGMGEERLQTLSILREDGADPERIIFGHSDWIADKMPLMLELLKQGVYIQFDLVGRVGVALTLEPITEATHPSFFAGTALVGAAIPKLVEAGYGDRVLLSQDVCTKSQLKHYGGEGYSFILDKFLPLLRTKGVTEEQIHKFMVANPARVLTFVAPK